MIQHNTVLRAIVSEAQGPYKITASGKGQIHTLHTTGRTSNQSATMPQASSNREISYISTESED